MWCKVGTWECDCFCNNEFLLNTPKAQKHCHSQFPLHNDFFWVNFPRANREFPSSPGAETRTTCKRYTISKLLCISNTKKPFIALNDYLEKNQLFRYSEGKLYFFFLADSLLSLIWGPCMKQRDSIDLPSCSPLVARFYATLFLSVFLFLCLIIMKNTKNHCSG